MASSNSDASIPKKLRTIVPTPSGVRATLCRFDDSRKIVSEERLLTETRYSAICHVWGKIEEEVELQIEGIEEKVKASEEKKEFIEKKLREVIGNAWFWMDILCLDQSEEAKEALVAATQHIPAVFLGATKTVVIRDGFGLRDCCAKAIGDIHSSHSMSFDWKTKLIAHEGFAHKGWNLREGILDRLWPLQEICLSDSIQFVCCKEDPAPDEKTLSTRNHVANYLQDSLINLAILWDSAYGSNGTNPIFNRDRLNFISAYIHNGTVTRNRNGYTTQHSFQYNLGAQFNSVRVTSKPRDFILAIMPQFKWYSVPPNAKQLKFGKLFLDCCKQASEKGVHLSPLISLEANSNTNNLPVLQASENIPEPTCLGDFAKLLFGPSLVNPIPLSLGKSETETVNVKPILGRTGPEAFEIIKNSILYSTERWVNAVCGELFKYGDLPERSIFHDEEATGNPAERKNGYEPLSRDIKNQLKILYFMYSRYRTTNPLNWYQWRGIYRWLVTTAPQLYIDRILQQAALINCGLGVSALDWLKQNVDPIVVQFRGKEILALAARQDVEGYLRKECEFRVVPAVTSAGWKRFILVAVYAGNPCAYNVGLFPSDVDFSRGSK